MVSQKLFALAFSLFALSGVEARACIRSSSTSPSLSQTDLPSPTSSIPTTPAVSSTESSSTPATSDVISTPSTTPATIADPSTTLATSLSTTPSTTPSETPSTTLATLTTTGITSTAASTPASSTPESTLPATTTSVPATTSTVASTSTAPACTPTNLVTNPSFESGISPWINFQGGLGSSNGVVNAKDGSTYFLASLTGSNSFISVRQELQMEIGSTYNVRAYYGLGSRQNFGSGMCNLQLTMGGDLQGAIINLAPMPVGQYQLFERNYVATDTSVVIRYVFTCSGVSSVDGLLDLITVPSLCPLVAAPTAT